MKIKRIATGITSPISKKGKYLGGNKNLMNLAEDYTAKKASYQDILKDRVKEGAKKFLESQSSENKIKKADEYARKMRWKQQPK